MSGAKGKTRSTGWSCAAERENIIVCAENSASASIVSGYLRQADYTRPYLYIGSNDMHMGISE